MGDRSPSSPQEGEAPTSSSPSFPFFNHDATTLPNHLPPSIDDKPTARQKRKRTSPEDQAVLEAYYARDPKPDKAARLELVKKVALGEKEVQVSLEANLSSSAVLTNDLQIWFQNRRQSSRRKSRPLLPHEIAQYQLSKSGVAPDVTPSGPLPDPPQHHPQSEGRHSVSAPLEDSASRQTLPGSAEPEPNKQSEDSSSPPDIRRVAQDASENVAHPRQSSFAFSSQPTESVTSFEAPLSSTVSLGQPANPRSAPVFYDGRPEGGMLPAHAHPSRPGSPRRVRKSSSFVRLSMNSEGGAEVIAKDTSSPSPPRASMSQSIYSGITGPAVSSTSDATTSQASASMTGTTLHRASSGRSRDSRAWEFWCDKDCRSELEQKAEKEASGSAADAIQLLRSTSGRNILGAVPAKRNSAPRGHSHGSKRLRREGRMPLQRSSTSNGRLQGKELEPSSKRVPKLKDTKSVLSVHIPGNDSDKENWSPNSDSQSDEHSIVADADAENGSHGRSSKGPFTFDRRRSGAQRESIDPENDPEIAAFMRAGRESDKVSDHEELDCVQGLLSLSQGNWR